MEQERQQEQLRWLIRIGTVAVFLGVLVSIGYYFEWTGFGKSVREVGAHQDLRRAKTLWDWLQLLVVPAALALGVVWLNWAQRTREKEAEEMEARTAAQAEEQRAQDAALGTYINSMGNRLAKYRKLAREKQETEKRYQEYKILYEAEERSYQKEIHRLRERFPQYAEWIMNMPKKRPSDWKGHWINPDHVKSLAAKDRQEIEDLEREIAKLNQQVSDLAEEVEPRREGAVTTSLLLNDQRTLIRAQTLTVLERVGKERKRAIMRFLSEAELLNRESPMLISLSDADFRGADLSRMKLTRKCLREARLTDADLNDTDLAGADLEGAEITNEQLDKCTSLKDATMPDGQTLRGDKTPNGPTFEDWRKERGPR